MTRRTGAARRRAHHGYALHGALPNAHCKDDLSVAYAHAVATAIGVTCEAPKRDINGWDVRFRALDTEQADGEQLSVPLKCTVNRLTRVSGGRELSLTIPGDDYEQLRTPKTHPPRMLVVVEVPHPRCAATASCQRVRVVRDPRCSRGTVGRLRARARARGGGRYPA
jgi:hypothetical protein